MFTNSYCHWTHEERLDDGEKSRIEEVDGIRVVWLRTIHYTGNGVHRGLNMISNAWRSISVARTLSDVPDVVIGPSVPLGTGWAAARIAESRGAAFVFEVRDVWPTALVDDGGLSKRNPVYFIFRYMEKSLYRKSQRISSAVPLLFDHVASSGANPDKIVWIPNGVDFERFSGLTDYDGGVRFPLVAMYVGGFGVAHDVISIVRAAKVLQDNKDDRFRFVIVGNGVKRPECEREASANGLENIEFRDSVPKSEVPQLQMESHILIASVTDSAAYRFGLNLNKLYDYFASGRPVIFSGNAPNDPVAASGGGFTIAPEDPDAMAEAMKKFAEMTPEERVDMGRRGRAYVESEFGMGKLGERMENLLVQARTGDHQERGIKQ